MKRIDFANLFPQLNGSVYTQKEASNYGGDKYSNDPETGAKATVSWEVDLWGNLRWAKDKSMADFLGSIEAQRALKMSLIAEVAQAYFELVALDNELAIVKQTLNAREEGVRLAKIRFEGGLTSETSYQQAQVEYARTATLVPDLERKISIKENDIAFLAGEYPKQIERSIMPDEVKLPESLPIGLPSTLLERRPDVRQAEQRLIAANAAVGIAYTNMFPKLSLTAQYGLESGEMSDLLKSPIHYLSANLLGPIFAMGKNRAIVKAKKAAYEQECYNYEKSVLTAFKDARNAIVDFNKIKEIYESRLQLELSSKTNMELAQLQYINGVIGYLDVLDAQRSYFDAQIGLSNAVRDKQITMVRLYKALGGGCNKPSFFHFYAALQTVYHIFFPLFGSHRQLHQFFPSPFRFHGGLPRSMQSEVHIPSARPCRKKQNLSIHLLQQHLLHPHHTGIPFIQIRRPRVISLSESGKR